MKMINRIRSYQLWTLILLVTFTNSCKEDAAIIPTGPVNKTVTDVDGNIYNTVQIGGQTWMTENLRTTKYNDGRSIPFITDDVTWEAHRKPAYCWSYNDIAHKTTYGALYNWYTVHTDKLAPIGWHVPTHEDFATLITYLGGEEVAGGKLKEIGFTHWNDPNKGATNESGFTALPGAYRDENGFIPGRQGNSGDWWTVSESSPDAGISIALSYYSSKVSVYFSYYKRRGHSVRCIKDDYPDDEPPPHFLQ